MTVKERLHKIIDELDDQRAEEALTLLTGLETAAAENVDFGQGTSEDDPFWDLIDLIGDECVVPTDVSANIHKYVADAIEDEWRR